MNPMMSSILARLQGMGRGVVPPGGGMQPPQIPTGNGVMGLPSGFAQAAGAGAARTMGAAPPQPQGGGWQEKLGLVAGALGGPAQAGPQPMSPMTQPLPMQIQPLMPQMEFQRFFMGGGGGGRLPPGLLG